MPVPALSIRSNTNIRTLRLGVILTSDHHNNDIVELRGVLHVPAVALVSKPAGMEKSTLQFVSAVIF